MSDSEQAPAATKKKSSRAKKDPNAPKGKVGRPPKPKIGPPIPKDGIIAAPIKPENVVELSYYDPTMFKTLFGYYKRAEVGEVYMTFTPTGLTILAKDHGGHSTSKVEVYGAEMNSYYCGEPLITVCVSHKNMNNIFKTVNKSYSRIAITMRHQDYRSKMFLAFEDRENGAYDVYDVQTIDPVAKPAIEDESDTYPLCFSMSAKRLRETVKGAKPFGGTIKIERSDGLLQITSDGDATAAVTKSCIFNKEKKMIRDNLGNDIISVSLDVDVIKSFSEVTTPGDIIVSADQFRPLKIELILAQSMTRAAAADDAAASAPVTPTPACKMSVFFLLKTAAY